MGAMPERSKPMLALIDDLGHIMLKVTGYVMLFAPLASGRRSWRRCEERSRRVVETDRVHGGFYLSLMILWGILVVSASSSSGPDTSFVAAGSEPYNAFSTASSEAATTRMPTGSLARDRTAP